ncbi:unnamed protein product [Ectocarpus sp. 8 AP-2014]
MLLVYKTIQNGYMKKVNSEYIKDVVPSLKDAEIALRLATMIKRNEWDLPIERRRNTN